MPETVSLQGWVTAEIAAAVHMRVTKYLATGYFCSVSKYKRHPEKPGRVVCSYVMSAATAAVPAGRKDMCVQFLGLLAFSSSLIARALLTTGSVNSAN